MGETNTNYTILEKYCNYTIVRQIIMLGVSGVMPYTTNTTYIARVVHEPL